MSPRFWSGGAAVAVCAGVLVLLSGCGSDPTEPRLTVEGALSSSERQGLVDLAVSAEQLPPLRRTTQQLSSSDVAAQAALPDLEQTLEATGFGGGVKVEYRGDSRQLTGVESQVLMFSTTEGAIEFSDYLVQHAASFFGDPIKVKAIVVDGRDGWRIDPPICGCAGAQPLSAGAVRVGTNVVVLQITGPKADQTLVQDLLAASLKSSP